jgi:hypothetical protein
MTWLRKRGRRTVGLVAAVVATGTVLTLTAGGPEGSGVSPSGDREAKYKRVLRDPHPRPADVIWAAGAPSGTARADNGSMLLMYDLRNVEDDEGPAATAWRIVDRDGRTVAEHAEHTDMEAPRVRFKGARGGFVRVPGEGMGRPYGLDVRGKRHKVVTSGTSVGSRAGDVLLAERETNVYRPAARTVAPLAGVPDRAVHLAVDERGTAWNLVEPLTDEPHRVVWQRDGRTLGSRVVPKPYGAGDVAARGGTAALSLTRIENGGEDGGEDVRVRGLLITSDGGKHWRKIVGGGIPWKELETDPEWLDLEVLADGRVLVGEEGGRHWLATDRTNTAFRQLRTPVKFSSFAVDGTTLYGIADATTPSYDLVKGEGLWISGDGGRTWRRHK